MPKFVQRHQSQLYLLPPDLRDWLPEDDLAHFVVEAVERVPLERFQVNERGTGSAQYHPRMMLALLVYCYANGIFGSRRIERATYRDIGVRYVAANCHPDHDTICTFRRSNFDAVAEAFLQVLLLAKELQLLRVGTVSVDGTKVDANANKRNSLRYDRAGALREQLRGEIEGLLDQAEHADTDAAPDPQGLPEELSRRDKLRVKLDRACAELERRAQARADSERAEYERKVAARERRTGSRKGRHIKPPTEAPEAEEQINLTDADSALMRKSRRHEYRQAYNAQAAVDADGSQLVLGARVSVCASDRNELVADVDAIPAALGAADRVQWRTAATRRAARCRNWQVAVWRCWWRRGRKANGASTTSDRSRRTRWRRSRRRTGSSRCSRRWHCRSTGRITVCASRRWSRCSGS